MLHQWYRAIKRHPFLSFAIFIFLALFVALIINKRFNFPDFRVYFLAAQQFFADRQVYGIPFGIGSGLYKYSPFALYFFLPFLPFPLFVAKTLYYIIGSAGIIITLFYSYTLLNRIYFPHSDNQFRGRDLTLLLVFLVVVVHFYRELDLGNVNLILLLILLFALSFILDGKSIFAGILIAVAILFKPHFIVLIPLLALRRKWMVLTSLVAMMIIGLISPALIAGWQGNIDLHHNWLSTMLRHNDALRLMENPNTLQRLFYHYGLRFVFTDVDYLYVYVVVIIAAGLMLWLIITNNRFISAHPDQKNALLRMHFSLEYILLIGLVPSITYTDTEHFLFSLPVIMLLIVFLRQKDLSGRWLTTLSVLAMVLYGANWHDLWGHRLSVWLESAGFLGLGNILIIFCTLYWFYIWRRQMVSVDGEYGRNN